MYVCVQLSHSWGQSLGTLNLPLREVLMEPGLVLDRWFSLEGALPESQLLMRVTLKVRLITIHPGLNSLHSPVCAGVLSLHVVSLSPLQVLDTQLAVCRRAPGDVDGDASGDDVIPRWVPSHLDIRQRSAFSM